MDPVSPTPEADPRHVQRARAHEATHSELVAHPAPELCDCPGHSVFRALADVAADAAHETLRLGRTCPTCGYRAPGWNDAPAPGQLTLTGSPADDSAAVLA